MRREDADRISTGGDVRKKEREVGENENRWDENKSVWKKCETEIEVFWFSDASRGGPTANIDGEPPVSLVPNCCTFRFVYA